VGPLLRSARRHAHLSFQITQFGLAAAEDPARAMKDHASILMAVTLAILMLGACVSAAAEGKQKGTPETPPNAEAVVGDYYRGNGTSYNVYLTLKADGSYTADWQGCLGKYGEASGQWALKGQQIVFQPAEEKDMMRGHLKVLDVLKFKGAWILVPADERRFYDTWGVSAYSCFQKQRKKPPI
jgi:hypothetical protein